MSEQSENKTNTTNNRNISVSRKLLILVFLLVIAACIQSYYIYNLSTQLSEIKKNPVVGIVEKVITSPIHMKTQPAVQTTAQHPAQTQQPPATEPEKVKTFVPIAVQKNKTADEEETAQVIKSPIPEENLNEEEPLSDNDLVEQAVNVEQNQDNSFTQEPDKYLVRLAVPGLDEKNLSVKMKGNLVVVSGMLKQQTRSNDGANVVIQNVYNQFSQTFNIPGDVIKSKIKSSISKDGILTITLPRETPAKLVSPAGN